MSEKTVIYRPWPAEVVQAALNDFGHHMRDGANVEQLQAGLLALDFLLSKSELNDHQTMRYQALQDEAGMRMELMQAQDESDPPQDDAHNRAYRYLTRLEREFKTISRRMQDEGQRFLFEYRAQFNISNGVDE